LLQATTAPPTETASAMASRIRLNMMSGSSVARRAPPLREPRVAASGCLPGWPRGWPGRPRGQKVATARERTPVQMATDRCRLLAARRRQAARVGPPVKGDAGTHRREPRVQWQ
jgi:hypothetical protein